MNSKGVKMEIKNKLDRSRSKSLQKSNKSIKLSKSNKKIAKIQKINKNNNSINRGRQRNNNNNSIINNKNNKNDKNDKNNNNNNNNKNINNNNSSLKRSQSKKNINEKKKQIKNNKRNQSQPKLINNSRIKSQSIEKNNKKNDVKINKNNSKIQSPQNKNNKNVLKNQKVPLNTIKIQQKQMGLIYFRPQHDKVIFKSLEITNDVFQKYLDMINNDNDTNYVINALPEFRQFQKQDDSLGRDFVSGKITRLSGIFDNLSVDKIINSIKRNPIYYHGQCGKNLYYLRIVLITKYKVQVDIGFLQYSIDGDKLTIFRIYISRIYRRINYLGYAYIEILQSLINKQSSADRWSIFILERNVTIHKFFKYLGFKIQKIATQSKNKNVDYFQQFTIKKKQLQVVINSLK